MLILEFQPSIQCQKCGHVEDFRPSFCSGEAKSECSEGPKVPHIHLICARCNFAWHMIAANDDIEQEFEDLDKYTETCPMCRYKMVTFEYCDGQQTLRWREHASDVTKVECTAEAYKVETDREHLHAECGFCEFMWLSETKDFVPTSKVERPKDEGLKPVEFSS